MCCTHHLYAQVDLKHHAARLADSALQLVMNKDDMRGAIALLNQATEADPGFVMGFANKLTFQLSLQQFDDALLTANALLHLRPFVPEYNQIAGVIHEKKGDTLISRQYFLTAQKILDSTTISDRNRTMLPINRALNLILLNKQEEGRSLLKDLYAKETTEFNKALIKEFINTSREELVKKMIGARE
jgi:tetratricopeptide (TPR) repeat protein